MRDRPNVWLESAGRQGPGTRHLQVLCLGGNESREMKLGLIEQACGCSTVRGGGGVNVRARRSVWRVLAARTRHLHLLPL